MNMRHFFSLLPVLFAPIPTFAADAHVHGVATLQIAVDGSTLHLNFSSPLDSLLGFEHQPRSEKQIASVRHMSNQLRQADRMFQPTVAAGCTLKSSSLESPVLETGEHKAHDHEGHDHMDLKGEYLFHCAKPNELHDLEVNLFSSFSGLRQLKIEAVTPQGQAAATLTPAKRQITW